jgi:hypothetical protein
MFCPQCGQQQPSEELRFCPRCGLSLWPHAALLAAGNNVATDPGRMPAPIQTARRINTRRAAKLLFFSLLSFPLFLLLGIAIDGGEPLVVPFLMFLAGLGWLCYARLFSDDTVPVAQQTPRREFGANAERPALNAQQFVPAASFNQQRANTAEMVQPPSVTENTTRLLDDDA